MPPPGSAAANFNPMIVAMQQQQHQVQHQHHANPMVGYHPIQGKVTPQQQAIMQAGIMSIVQEQSAASTAAAQSAPTVDEPPPNHVSPPSPYYHPPHPHIVPPPNPYYGQQQQQQQQQQQSPALIRIKFRDPVNLGFLRLSETKPQTSRDRDHMKHPLYRTIMKSIAARTGKDEVAEAEATAAKARASTKKAISASEAVKDAQRALSKALAVSMRAEVAASIAVTVAAEARRKAGNAKDNSASVKTRSDSCESMGLDIEAKENEEDQLRYQYERAKVDPEQTKIHVDNFIATNEVYEHYNEFFILSQYEGSKIREPSTRILQKYQTDHQ